jgi:hypothetical protein
MRLATITRDQRSQQQYVTIWRWLWNNMQLSYLPRNGRGKTASLLNNEMQLDIDVAAGPVPLKLRGELGETMAQRQHHECLRDAKGTRFSYYKEHIRQWVQPEDIVAAHTFYSLSFLLCLHLCLLQIECFALPVLSLYLFTFVAFPLFVLTINIKFQRHSRHRR